MGTPSYPIIWNLRPVRTGIIVTSEPDNSLHARNVATGAYASFGRGLLTNLAYKYDSDIVSHIKHELNCSPSTPIYFTGEAYHLMEDIIEANITLNE